jgi:hypothetical protein
MDATTPYARETSFSSGRKVLMMDHASEQRAYEAPKLTPLGSVHALTQAKEWGPADGALWIVPIANVS